MNGIVAAGAATATVHGGAGWDTMAPITTLGAISLMANRGARFSDSA